ncbi:YdcF family protein [Fodinicola feengrottensis]|uniref:YdcF family protein n=1 Tax=Fodinicola feengrottensis TaxID=435914 RepID=UPI0013D7A71D|nr:YdcF family protein [Fodinicola feengrottensis]
MPAPELTAEQYADVETLWDYHQLGHQLRPADIAIGLGSHDLGVATHTAQLFDQGLFPRIVFTGANAPTTIERFPRGEAVHYREHALELGVPDNAILIETKARNTGENFTLTRALLKQLDIQVRSAIVVSRPYQQRRAYATAKRQWSGLDIICSSEKMPLTDYIAAIGDTKRVIDMLVGDTQRIITVHAHQGFAVAQDIPEHVQAAYERLRDAGFTSRILP